MAQSLIIPISLGTSRTGLTLRAQLVDVAGANVGSPITTGFTEQDKGNYRWYYAGYADDFIGGVDFFDDGTDEFLVSTAINAADFGSGAGNDPLESEVPGDYVEPQAGYYIGLIPDIKAKTDTIGASTISVTSALAPGGDLHLYVGDSYSLANGNALDFTDEDDNWPNLTGLVIHFYLQSLDVVATVVTPTGSKLIRVELTSAQSATLNAHKGQYALKIIYSPTNKVTIVEGRSIVKTAP